MTFLLMNLNQLLKAAWFPQVGLSALFNVFYFPSTTNAVGCSDEA